MSNLIKCKDCGHTVSKRAKTCPSCGVRNPGRISSPFGQFIVLVVILWFGVPAIIDQLGRTNSPSISSSPVRTAPVRKPRVYTDAEIQEAIAQSDDYDQYRAEFTEAAKVLLTSRRCGRYEMTQYGGFVKSQTHKNKPVYFTYCGGTHLDNRIYIDVSTGELSTRR